MYIDIFVVQRCALQRCCRIQLYAFNEDRELLDTREYHLIEGSLNSKLPTIWTVEKQMRKAVKSEGRRYTSGSLARKSEERRYIRGKC